ncbi:MAG: hypothetical protein ACREO8_04110 [Luteimonas sp.]
MPATPVAAAAVIAFVEFFAERLDDCPRWGMGDDGSGKIAGFPAAQGRTPR